MADTSQTFNFELVSPDKVLVSEAAWQVVIPGEEGYFGVRAGHMSLIAAVKPGVVDVYASEGAAPKKLFIAGGFADVTAANCTLLAEQAMDLAELDAGTIDAAIARLNDEIKAASDPGDKTLLQKRLKLETAKREALQKAA